jgi:HD-GYP domain-containing protein (c-di-GMP phosphodiesterase class II)
VGKIKIPKEIINKPGALMSHGEAIEELRRCAGTQFDPQVVEALILAAEVPRPAEILPAA